MSAVSLYSIISTGIFCLVSLLGSSNRKLESNSGCVTVAVDDESVGVEVEFESVSLATVSSELVLFSSATV